MSSYGSLVWTRRLWLTNQSLNLAAIAAWSPRRSADPQRGSFSGRVGLAARTTRVAAQTERLDAAPWQALAQQAVDAARAAGARYADARLTRVVIHSYGFGIEEGDRLNATFRDDDEYVGVGVRALVDGYWGFSASAVIASDEVVRLAQDAVGQAKENAKGSPWTVDLGHYPVATGT